MHKEAYNFASLMISVVGRTLTRTTTEVPVDILIGRSRTNREGEPTDRQGQNNYQADDSARNMGRKAAVLSRAVFMDTSYRT